MTATAISVANFAKWNRKVSVEIDEIWPPGINFAPQKESQNSQTN